MMRYWLWPHEFWIVFNLVSADIRDQTVSIATLQRQVEDSGSTLITMHSRFNSLESVATRFGDFEESTNRRFRTEVLGILSSLECA